MSPIHAHTAALRSDSEGMKAKAAKQEAKLQPSEFDAILPIDSSFGPDNEAVTAYIDSKDEADTPIDFKALSDYIYDRRELAMNKAGMRYDPIDDAAFVPSPGDFVSKMRSDQIERHVAEIMATGRVDVARVAKLVSPAYLKQHRGELEKLGLKRSLPRRVTDAVLRRSSLSR